MISRCLRKQECIVFIISYIDPVLTDWIQYTLSEYLSINATTLEKCVRIVTLCNKTFTLNLTICKSDKETSTSIDSFTSL